MTGKHEKKVPDREQFKSLDIKDNVEDSSMYDGDDRSLSTQTITNSHYRPERDWK